MIPPASSVTCANSGTVQDPVRREPPVKLAVSNAVPVNTVGTVASSFVTVETFELLEGEVVFGFAPPVVMLNGEQPTKLGAVELTAAHSCILN